MAADGAPQGDRTWEDPLKSTSLFVLLSVVVLGCVAAPAWADITVLNPSFETVDPIVGLNTPCTIPLNCSFNFGPIPDWTLTGLGGSWHTSSAFINLPLADGHIVAYSNGGTISQTLTGTLLIPNTTYTLSVDIGHRLDDGFVTTYTIALYAGGTFLKDLSGSNGVIPIGTFADETLTFTTDATVAPGDLRIVLSSAGQQTDFDNVRLTATSLIPEPSSLSLLAAGLGLLFFVFRRR
jgi:hypothetical protein